MDLVLLSDTVDEQETIKELCVVIVASRKSWTMSNFL